MASPGHPRTNRPAPGKATVYTHRPFVDRVTPWRRAYPSTLERCGVLRGSDPGGMTHLPRAAGDVDGVRSGLCRAYLTIATLGVAGYLFTSTDSWTQVGYRVAIGY